MAKRTRSLTARLGSCEDCHDWVIAVFNGAVPKRCDDCRKAAARVRARVWYYQNRERALARAATPAARARASAQRRARWRANPEVPRAKARARYAANRAQVMAWNRAWQDAHPEKVRGYKNAWKAANKARVRTYWHVRKARQLAATVVDFTDEQLEQRLSMFSGCWVCAAPAKEIDHVKPLSSGGPHMLANLRPICSFCNRSKGARWPWPCN